MKFYDILLIVMLYAGIIMLFVSLAKQIYLLIVASVIVLALVFVLLDIKYRNLLREIEQKQKRDSVEQ